MIFWWTLAGGVKELEPSVVNESVVLKGIALVHLPPDNKQCRSPRRGWFIHSGNVMVADERHRVSLRINLLVANCSRRWQHGWIVIGNGGIGVDQAHGLRLSSHLEIKRHCIITNNEFSPSAFIQCIVISDYTLYIAGMLHWTRTTFSTFGKEKHHYRKKTEPNKNNVSRFVTRIRVPANWPHAKRGKRACTPSNNVEWPYIKNNWSKFFERLSRSRKIATRLDFTTLTESSIPLHHDASCRDLGVHLSWWFASLNRKRCSPFFLWSVITSLSSQIFKSI